MRKLTGASKGFRTASWFYWEECDYVFLWAAEWDLCCWKRQGLVFYPCDLCYWLKRALWKAPRCSILKGFNTFLVLLETTLLCCFVFVTVIPLFCSEQALDWRIHRGMADSRGLVSFKCLHNNDFTAWSFRLLWPKCLALFFFFFLFILYFFLFICLGPSTCLNTQ